MQAAYLPPFMLNPNSALSSTMCCKPQPCQCPCAPSPHPLKAALPTPATRRTFLFTLALTVLPLPTHSALDHPELHGLDEQSPATPAFKDLGDGLKSQEIVIGSGDQSITPGAQVALKYVLRRSNGYFIDASYGFDRFDTFKFRAGSGEVVEGFERAVRGMKMGGRRRFVVPPALGYVKGVGKECAGPIPPDFGARRSLASHAKEPLLFEVMVVKIRP